VIKISSPELARLTKPLNRVLDSRRVAPGDHLGSFLDFIKGSVIWELIDFICKQIDILSNFTQCSEIFYEA